MSRPNILVIVLDAARAENFSLLGYHKQTTPNLERYAAQLAWYQHGISAATWTLPSSASLFTGSYLSSHRLVIDGDRLATRYTTLAEMLSQEGYYTAKVTGQVPYVSEFSGLDRGFHHSYEPEVTGVKKWWRNKQRQKTRAAGEKRVEGVDLGLDLKTEAQMNAQRSVKGKAKFWASGFSDAGAAECFAHVTKLWQTHSDTPRFVYMHLQETHAEYRPPHRFRKKFIPGNLQNRNFAEINQRPNPHAAGLVSMTDQDYEILTGLYDGCIAYLDEQIGKLLDQLSGSPDFDNTMVIVTADHGDCIGRHGVLGHQFVCYDELIRVPWIVKWPKSVGITGEQDALVQHVDLVPTVCKLLNTDSLPGVEGSDFIDPIRTHAYSELLKPFGRSAVKQGLHTMTPHYQRAVLSVRSKTHKVIRYSNHLPDEAFDLVKDPGEQTNLAATDEGKAASEVTAMFETMDQWVPRWKDAADEICERVFVSDDDTDHAITEEVEERLRALGYLD